MADHFLRNSTQTIAGIASAPLLGLCSAKTCFCLLTRSFELAHACRAGGPLSVGLGLVQVETLAGVLCLGSQIVQMLGGHGFESKTSAPTPRRLAAEAPSCHHRAVLENPASEPGLAFSIGVNNLKLTSSQQVIDVVMRAMLICGIAGYRNDSKLTLGRHLRDAIGAGVMVNNDRILGQNATMQIGLREG